MAVETIVGTITVAVGTIFYRNKQCKIRQTVTKYKQRVNQQTVTKNKSNMNNIEGAQR